MQNTSQVVELSVDEPKYVPACKWDRLGAFMLDLVIQFLIFFPAYFFISTSFFENSINQLGIGISLSSAALIFFGICNCIFFLLVHGKLLATKGQTVGKKLLGIAVVSNNENKPLKFWVLFISRYSLFGVLALMTHYGEIAILINALFIFGKESRCLHDYIANTKVVRVR